MAKKFILGAVSFILLLPVLVLGYLQFFFCKDLSVEKMSPYIMTELPAGLDVRFYGTGCFYIGNGTSAVLTDPFFSNPSPFQSFFHLQADKSSLSVVADSLWTNVKAFVTGHSHYDHCLELPYAMEMAPDAMVIGNTSLLRLFSQQLKKDNFINADSARQFIYSADSSMRIYPALSRHSPHIGKIIFANGDIPSPLHRLPKNWLRWKCGANYSYLVDFMEGDSIKQRIFISGGDNGFPHNAAEANIVVEQQPDLIILPFWDAKVMEDRIRRARKAFGPAPLLVCHWNNFFQVPGKQIQYISRSKIETSLPAVQALFPDMPLRILLPEQFKQKQM